MMNSFVTIPDYSDLATASYKTDNYISHYYPGFYELLQNKYPETTSMAAKLYMFYNGIEEHPRCVCGKLLEYRDQKHGFRHFCSVKCATNDKNVQEKAKKAQEERYGGVGFASQRLLEKSRTTCQKRYGVSNGMQDSCIKKKQRESTKKSTGYEYASQNPTIMQKTKKTQEERYGGFGLASPVLYAKFEKTQIERHGGIAMASPELRQKSAQTCLEKYGHEYANQSDCVKNKIQKSKSRGIMKKYPIVESISCENDARIYQCRCPHPECSKCDGYFTISNELFYRRLQDHTELCTKLLPPQQSFQSNTSLEIFVKIILDEFDVDYIQNDRELLGGQEVDFYIPSRNLAIECNGIRWHSDKYKDNQYHRKKFNNCAEKQVHLVQLWEDWIQNKPAIVRSILLNKLGLITNKIHARQCVIKQIDSKTARKFFDTNHIQGFSAALHHIGLFCGGVLVSAMSFSKRKPGQGSKTDESWELVRFCTLLETIVVGGASKLFSYFLSKYHPDSVVSFSSNDISNGNLYNKLGFQKQHQSTSYWYIDCANHRYHRFNFSKGALVKTGADPTLTEREIMNDLPYHRIYDAGTTKWIYENTGTRGIK